jgi:hypothetical protein
VASTMPRLLYPWERDPVPIVQEAGWVPGPVWMAAENLAPNRIQSLDRPAHSELLCRLRYPSTHLTHVSCYFKTIFNLKNFSFCVT